MKSRQPEHQLSLGFDSPNGAIFSECRRYRYVLWRQWNDKLPFLTLCMLNPSDAGEEENDQTITRCIVRAKQMGSGGIRVVNLFAWVDSDRTVLSKVVDPIGEQNDQYILEACRDAKTVLCGWGVDGKLMGRGKQLIAYLLSSGIKPMALGTNRDGSPVHPLYKSYAIRPKALTI